MCAAWYRICSRRYTGKGGSSGSGGLQTLMDTIPFRPRPKVVDLTAERKLGEKVRLWDSESSYVFCGLRVADPTARSILMALDVGADEQLLLHRCAVEQFLLCLNS